MKDIDEDGDDNSVGFNVYGHFFLFQLFHTGLEKERCW